MGINEKYLDDYIKDQSVKKKQHYYLLKKFDERRLNEIKEN